MSKENPYHLRKMVAQQAARMIAEDGIADFAYAKKKAGRQLGVIEGNALPSNAEIEEEIRLYHSLFLAEVHPEHLRELRHNALFTMQLLERFNPHLTGAVLDGTAGVLAETHLYLYADSIKEVEMFLLNQQIPFEVNERSYRVVNDGKRDKRADLRKKVPMFILQTDAGPIKLSVFDIDDIRVPIKHAVSGENADKLNIEGLKALLG
ncbi:MAG: hypothetical protein FJY53_05835 [Betaproteobacteria bacterium]|nr:hypothetical protein [Betaproteobacteria bacterium]